MRRNVLRLLTGCDGHSDTSHKKACLNILKLQGYASVKKDVYHNGKSGDYLRGKDWSQTLNIRRGDIYYADLSPVVGSEQGGMRPVLIVQNDVGNKYSPTVIAAAITSKMSKTRLPTHIDIYAERAGLAKDSVILLEQIRTIDKKRLGERMGHLDDETMGEVNHAITISFGLGAE